MLIHIQDDILRLQGMGVLEPLLADRSTGRNILWATDAYTELGRQYARNEEITAAKITGDCAGIIRTRARKAFEQQSQRTKQRAEVFTPLWIVEKMNDHLDEVWFQRKAGFHKLDESGRISFNTNKTWQQYVENRRLEITCGEAPFLTTRYDAVSGEVLAFEKRVGLLDRKLRAVNENTDTPGDWFTWALRALRATYGYEFQGDSLLIARINAIMAFWEAMEARWGQPPTAVQFRRAAEIVAWNLWQMDGLTDRVPYAKENLQLSLFDLLPDAKQPLPPYCRIKNWRQQRTNQFRSLKGERTRMKFDYIIGNPPYQDETLGDNKGFAPPIYDKFMEAAYVVADKVELVHPARFLFNAGSTPKSWNKKMLTDPHFKILHFSSDAKSFFPNTDIMGGIVISYRDKTQYFGSIKTFTAFPALNEILKKVQDSTGFCPFSDIVVTRTAYRLTERMHHDHPEARYSEDENGNNRGLLSKGHDYDMATNIFSSLPQIFYDEEPKDGETYIQIFGRVDNTRARKYIRREYVNNVPNLFAWKVFAPKSNGSAPLGEKTMTPVIGQPVMGRPAIGHTESFISVGCFKTEEEATACYKYICSKFARCLLGILKVTQDNPPDRWKYVPLQDFTSKSDIDWSQSIADIDRQLYAKYGLDEKEIEFIETHVKEMA